MDKTALRATGKSESTLKNFVNINRVKCLKGIIGMPKQPAVSNDSFDIMLFALESLRDQYSNYLFCKAEDVRRGILYNQIFKI